MTLQLSSAAAFGVSIAAGLYLLRMLWQGFQEWRAWRAWRKAALAQGIVSRQGGDANAAPVSEAN